MKKTLLCIVLCIVIFTRCKKETDTITTATLHGQVYNMCTDSGLVNCTVFLKQNGNTLAQMQSGAGGNFSFSNVQIHSSSSYSYALATIDNPDGAGTLPPIAGGVAAINKSNLGQNYVLQVIPITLQWWLYFPAGTVVSSTVNDTLLLILQQKIFRKNFPSGNYLITLQNSPTYTFSGTGNYIGDLSFEWMGWWYSTRTKTKNGITTTKTDSFYVPWNASSTDTIPW